MSRPKRKQTDDDEDTFIKKVKDPCFDTKNIRVCQDVYIPYRLLENRAGCIFEYLRKIKGNVFLTYLVLPVVLSFTDDEKFRNEVIHQIPFIFSQGMVEAEYLSRNESKNEVEMNRLLITNLLSCNDSWNKKLKNYKEIKDKISVEMIPFNPKFYKTCQSVLFLKEIMGVISRDTFQEQTNYFLNWGELKLNKISVASDRKCKSYAVDSCIKDKDCTLRINSKGGKDCINKERFRTMKPGDKNAYYILEDNAQEKRILYRPLCIHYIISNNSGIFQHQEMKDGVYTDINEYTIVFPPFGGDFKSSVNGFWAFYWNGYIQNVYTKEGGYVGIQKGLLQYIDEWFESCRKVLLKIPKNAEIYVVGCSLGGALTNICCFRLLQEGFRHVHMYALGAPRVGDENFKKYMEKSKLEIDSANYVRMNGVVKNNKFHIQFDPVTRFPENTWSAWSIVGSHLRYVDNPKLRLFEAGLSFNPVFETFTTQPEFDMLPFDQARRLFLYKPNEGLPIDGNCEEIFPFLHSIGAYSYNNFTGARDFEPLGKRVAYTDFYDRIIDLNVEKCKN